MYHFDATEPNDNGSNLIHKKEQSRTWFQKNGKFFVPSSSIYLADMHSISKWYSFMKNEHAIKIGARFKCAAAEMMCLCIDFGGWNAMRDTPYRIMSNALLHLHP